MISICTFFWDDPKAKHKGTYEFTTRHVNRLAKGLRDNLTIPYEFVCITDNPTGIDTTFTRIIPLWDEFRDLGRCFVRLGLYSREIREVIGPRIANIDLDVAIVGNVDHIFGRTEPFVGYTDTKNPSCYSGARYMMDAGAKSQVYTSFKRLYNMVPEALSTQEGTIDRREYFRRFYNRFSPFVGSDQSWQTEVLGEGLPRIGQSDGVWDYWSVEDLPDLPTNSRIVFCNGMTRDLSMPSIQAKHKWASEYWNG